MSKITLSLTPEDQVALTKLAHALRVQTGTAFSTPASVLRFAIAKAAEHVQVAKAG